MTEEPVERVARAFAEAVREAAARALEAEIARSVGALPISDWPDVIRALDIDKLC